MNNQKSTNQAALNQSALIEAMREKKKEYGFSYGEIAKRSGLPLGTVQKVLGGFTKSPRRETLAALLDAAAISLMGTIRRLYPQGVFTCRAALHGPCALQGVCIVRLRMGNLLAAAAMGLMAYLVSGKKKEERKWSVIPLKT